jgi:hypothetical protein
LHDNDLERGLSVVSVTKGWNMRYVATTRLLAVEVAVLLGCSLGTHAARAAEAKAPAIANASAGANPSAALTTPAGANKWRYVAFQGRWWYWLPENRWVYWQDDRWNDFTPPAKVPATKVARAANPQRESAIGESPVGQDEIRPAYGHALSPMYSGPTGGDRDQVRPFYGHAESHILYGPSSERDEIGPFYGRALPGRFFGGTGAPNDQIRPFYGHAGSSYGY